ncbi:BRCT domain-containing protein [Aestuariibacter sp. A3R04]|uniref:BRCT domain-containing protein n=1 Tax=Aestuariibacter sp. A3R04 TaxID=2841571 RepID=UPI001C08EA98|nr:BRCT domain-containing protein [Aestuariibacter sp. A3R04]MBU3023275.1 BRCT domain-containing protein [Aestuariibacter sp. A3R04]
MEYTPSAIRAPHFFNKQRNLDKAVCGLVGILRGVSADKHLTAEELLYLNLWLKAQRNLRDDPDGIDLIDLIDDIVDDGVISDDEMRDLVTLCNDIANIRSVEFEGEYEAKINEFLGLLQGVIADGVVNTKEFGFICDWLDRNEIVEEDWLVRQVKSRITHILEDNEVSHEELTEFAEALKQLTGYQFDDTGDAECASLAYLEDQVKSLTECTNVCFTGKFLMGTRKTLEDHAKLVGLTPEKKITKKLNLLVIGELVTPDWRFQSYGRKIEQAVKYREAGVPIKILTEKTWAKFLKLD